MQPGSPGSTRGIMPVVGLSLMTVVSSVVSLNVALPDIAVSTGATQTQLTWIIDAYTVVFASLLFFAGALGDRFGRKRLLAIGLAIFGLASLAGTFVTDPTTLIAVRAIMGLGASAVMPTTLSVITTSLPVQQRARAIGVWVGIAGAGAVVGLFATGLLLQWFAWQSAFWLFVVLAAASLAGTFAFIPNSVDDEPPSIDAIGAALSFLGVGALIFGIIEGPSRGWADTATVGALITGVAALCLFVLWELRQAEPLLDPRLFALRGFSVSSLAITISFLCWFGLIFMMMQYLQFVVDYSPLQAALCLLPVPFVLIPSARFAPRIAQRIGFRPVVTTGMLCLAAGLTIVSRVNVDFSYPLFATGLALGAAGMGMAGTSPTATLTASLPTQKQGVASAMNDTSRELGSAIGIAVLGSILTQTYQSSMSAHLDSIQASANPATSASMQQLKDFALSSIAFTKSPALDQVAARIGQQRVDQLVAWAQQSFVDGVSAALLAAAAVALTGAVIVVIFGPRTSPPPA